MHNSGFINLVQMVYVTYIISVLLRTATATQSLVNTYRCILCYRTSIHSSNIYFNQEICTSISAKTLNMNTWCRHLMDVFRSNIYLSIVLHQKVLYTCFELKKEYKFTMSKEDYLYKYHANVLVITSNTVFVWRFVLIYFEEFLIKWNTQISVGQQLSKYNIWFRYLDASVSSR